MDLRQNAMTQTSGRPDHLSRPPINLVSATTLAFNGCRCRAGAPTRTKTINDLVYRSQLTVFFAYSDKETKRRGVDLL